MDIYYSKVARYEQEFRGSWLEIQDATLGTYIRLIPCPTSADTTVPFFWQQSRTRADLEEKYEEPLVKLAAGLALQIVGERLNEVPQVDHGHRKTKFSGDSKIERGTEWVHEAEMDLYVPQHGSEI